LTRLYEGNNVKTLIKQGGEDSDVQLSNQFQHLGQQTLQAMQNVGESDVNSGKETPELRDPSEVSNKGVKCVDEALIHTVRTDLNMSI
jgi:hypothetical protein